MPTNYSACIRIQVLNFLRDKIFVVNVQPAKTAKFFNLEILGYTIYQYKSRLAIRVLNYCKPCINAKRLNDVTVTEARGFITCTLSGC